MRGFLNVPEQISVAEVGKATGGMIVVANKIEGIRHIQSIVLTEKGIELITLDNPDQITDTRFEDKAIYTTLEAFDREDAAKEIMDLYPGCRVEFWDFH